MTNLLFSSAALSSAAGNYQTDFPLAGATYTGYSRHGILVCDSSPSPSLLSPAYASTYMNMHCTKNAVTRA